MAAIGLLVEDHADARPWLSAVLQQVFPGLRLTLAQDVAMDRATVVQLQGLGLAPELVDSHLPDGSGVEVIALLQQAAPGCLCVEPFKKWVSFICVVSVLLSVLPTRVQKATCHHRRCGPTLLGAASERVHDPSRADSPAHATSIGGL